MFNIYDYLFSEDKYFTIENDAILVNINVAEK